MKPFDFAQGKPFDTAQGKPFDFAQGEGGECRMRFTRGNTTIATIALVVGVVALALAFVAFNRTGQDTATVVREETHMVAQSAEQLAARTQAQTRLAALQAELAAERGYEEAEEEVVDLRADLALTYQDTGQGVREWWQQLDAELQQLEIQLREESADALLTLEEALVLLRQDVQSDDT